MEGSSSLVRLPDLVLEQIASHLFTPTDIQNFRLTCKKCHRVSLAKSILEKQVIDLRKVFELFYKKLVDNKRDPK